MESADVSWFPSPPNTHYLRYTWGLGVGGLLQCHALEPGTMCQSSTTFGALSCSRLAIAFVSTPNNTAKKQDARNVPGVLAWVVRYVTGALGGRDETAQNEREANLRMQQCM